MNKISDLKAGEFYYIEELERVAENFANCLGGLLSITAQNIKISLSEYEGVKINKIIASDYLLDKNQDNTIKLSQLLIGTKKDFIFSICIDVDKISERILNDKTVELIKLTCHMESVNNMTYTKHHTLKIKIMDDLAKNDIVKDIDVLRN